MVMNVKVIIMVCSWHQHWTDHDSTVMVMTMTGKWLLCVIMTSALDWSWQYSHGHDCDSKVIIMCDHDISIGLIVTLRSWSWLWQQGKGDVCGVTGTGSNACYIERLENVEMAEGNEPGPPEVSAISHFLDCSCHLVVRTEMIWLRIKLFKDKSQALEWWASQICSIKFQDVWQTKDLKCLKLVTECDFTAGIVTVALLCPVHFHVVFVWMDKFWVSGVRAELLGPISHICSLKIVPPRTPGL